MAQAHMEKSVTIAAAPATVWRALTDPEWLTDWQAAFMPGSQVETEQFRVGSEIYFIGPDGAGLQGRVVTNEIERELKVEFTGVVLAGPERRLSDRPEDQEWVGCQDTYLLSEQDGVTTLRIDSDVPGEQWAAMFDPLWDRALLRIKELAESGEAGR